MRNPHPERPLVVFVHLQKTGGSTLRQIFRFEYGAQDFFNLVFERHGEDLAEHWASGDQNRRVRAIAGHFDFGEEPDFGPNARYVTVLRDPVHRILSLYAYRRQHVLWQERMKDMSVSNFVTSDDDTRTIHNFQTRVLGQPGENPPRIATRATLDQAKRNIVENFASVGLTERFDESVLLMRRALHWSRWPFYERQNVSVHRPAVAELPHGLVAAIRERNALDVELHAWATERLQEAVEAAGPTFRAEAAAFRLMNSDSGRRAHAVASSARTEAVRVRRRVGRAARRTVRGH